MITTIFISAHTKLRFTIRPMSVIWNVHQLAPWSGITSCFVYQMVPSSSMMENLPTNAPFTFVKETLVTFSRATILLSYAEPYEREEVKASISRWLVHSISARQKKYSAAYESLWSKIWTNYFKNLHCSLPAPFCFFFYFFHLVCYIYFFFVYSNFDNTKIKWFSIKWQLKQHSLL